MLATAGYAATSDSDLIDPLTTARSGRVRRQARTVLVVDDEVAVQRLLKHFLEQEKGYNVVTALRLSDKVVPMLLTELTRRSGASVTSRRIEGNSGRLRHICTPSTAGGISWRTLDARFTEGLATLAPAVP
jgi:hypothetical protein